MKWKIRERISWLTWRVFCYKICNDSDVQCEKGFLFITLWREVNKLRKCLDWNVEENGTIIIFFFVKNVIFIILLFDDRRKNNKLWSLIGNRRIFFFFVRQDVLINCFCYCLFRYSTITINSLVSICNCKKLSITV